VSVLVCELPDDPLPASCEDVYSPQMADKTPTLAVLAERVNNAISNGKWVIALFIAALVAIFVRFDLKTGRLETNVAAILAEMGKAIPSEVDSIFQRPSVDSLNDAAAILAFARRQNRKSDKKSLTQVSEDLLKLRPNFEGSPAFWRASAELVSYRSQQEFASKLNGLSDCTKQEPWAHLYKLHPNPEGGTFVDHGPFHLQHCRIVLDSPEGQQKVNGTRSLGDVVFQDCLVIYTGKEIIPVLLVGKVYFQNCLLQFSIKDIPPQDGQALTTELLSASTTGTFMMPHS
jgi:hypothetical protein